MDRLRDMRWMEQRFARREHRILSNLDPLRRVDFRFGARQRSRYVPSHFSGRDCVNSAQINLQMLGQLIDQ